MRKGCLKHKSMFSWKSVQRLLLAVIALLTVTLLATEMFSNEPSTRGLTLYNPAQSKLSSTSSWRRLDCNGAPIQRSADANPSAGHLLTELILHITSINQSRIIRLLNQTLMKRSREAGPLLTDLCDFASKYRCPPCLDSRPLPKTALDPGIRLEHDGTMNGFKLPVITVQHSGRIGNLMSEYATAFALKKIYNGSVVLTPTFSRALRMYFKGISLPIMGKRVNEWTSVSMDFNRKRSYRALQLAAAGLLGPKAFRFTGFLHDLTLFNAFREEVRQELTFHEDTLQKATARLQGFMTMVKRDIKNELMTVIGVHVRLTDYSNHMYKLFTLENFTEPYERYLRRAVDYFTTRNNTLFVVTSDDIEEARNIFQRLVLRNVFVSQGSPEEDMCLLTLCDHNIITFGSYGFWTGYLGRGTTVYPQLSDATLEYPFSKPFYEKARVQNFVPIFFR